MKYKTQALSIFFSLFILNNLFSQDVIYPVGDSIKKYLYNEPVKAIGYCHEYIKLSNDNNDIYGLKISYSALAIGYGVINEPDSTLYYYSKSLVLEENPIDLIRRKFYIANVYDKNSNYNEALRIYSQILELAKKENDLDMINTVNFSIESIKSKVDIYKKGFPKESLTYLESIYNLEIKEGKLKELKVTRKNLIEVYIKDNQLEKAGVLIEEGLKQAERENNKEFMFYLHDLKSKINRFKENYTISINEAKKALRYAKDLKNQLFINQANFNLAEIAYVLEDYQGVLNYLKTVEYNKNNKTSLQLSRDYKLRADTYSKLDSLRLSNKYISKHLEENKKANKEYLEALKSIYTINTKEQVSEIQDNYEIELKEEKLQKEKHKKTKWYWIGISVALLLLILVLVTFFKNKSKVNQERFEELMRKINAFEERKTGLEPRKEEDIILEKEIVLEIEPSNIPKATETTILEIGGEEDSITIVEGITTEDPTYIIDDKKVEEILVKLLALEDKLYYLRQDCTLHNMAKRLKTNTSYLSKIINTHVGKSFSTYINELRINYAILELKNNRKLRSYSVKAIAQEMGYKNADAFTRYFKVATGITPAVYIKKVQGI
jgi:AraC-like DNA-binding protein